MLGLHNRLIRNYISLVHGLVEVIVDLLALLIDHGAPFIDDLNLLPLLPLDGDLKPLLVLANIINLLFEVDYKTLHCINQMILALQFQGKLVFFLLETLIV